MRDEAGVLELSVVVPALNERDNVETLIPDLHRVLDGLAVSGEIVLVDGGSRDDTAETAERLGARVVRQRGRGYGDALREGFVAARGRYVVTMDADHSHDPDLVRRLWDVRDGNVVGIASRYVQGGAMGSGRFRRVLSILLNLVFSRGLSLRARDLSSGFRIYPKSLLDELRVEGRDFDVLPELLVRAHAEGWRIVEVPLRYVPRRHGTSKARLLRLGIAYLRTFTSLWRLRNSIAAADYDERAFDSPVPFQRAWQRRRHAIVTANARTRQGRILDVGCGSSRILRDLPGAVGCDVSVRKLRYMHRYGLPLVAGSIFELPFADRSFDIIVCSEVIEHIPEGDAPFRELARVQAPAGLLILGTPDYGTRTWPAIESAYRMLAPGGYADEHITHYRHDELRSLLERFGYRHLGTEYVFGSEMILTAEKIC